MLYYKKKKMNGAGLVDSLIGAVTSQVFKDAAKEVTAKAIKEIGNRGAEKVIDKILPREPKPFVFKGKGLTEKNAMLIQDYVKK